MSEGYPDERNPANTRPTRVKWSWLWLCACKLRLLACAVHLRNMPKFVKQELVGPKAQYLMSVSIYAHVFADVYWIFDDICLSCLSGARTYHSSRDCSMTFSRDWKFLERAIQSWRSKSMLFLLRLTQEPCFGCGVAGSYHEVLRW